MKILHSRLIDCSGMTAAACSDLFLVALGHGINFKLRADLPTDVVHGSVTIAHNDPPVPHEIYVEIYDQDNLPTRGRRSRLRRPDIMPSEGEIKSRLDSR